MMKPPRSESKGELLPSDLKAQMEMELHGMEILINATPFSGEVKQTLLQVDAVVRQIEYRQKHKEMQVGKTTSNTD